MLAEMWMLSSPSAALSAGRRASDVPARVEQVLRQLDEGGAEIDSDTASRLNRCQQIANTTSELQNPQPGRHQKLEMLLEQCLVVPGALVGT
jgi:hypothetical protein